MFDLCFVLFTESLVKCREKLEYESVLAYKWTKEENKFPCNITMLLQCNKRTMSSCSWFSKNEQVWSTPTSSNRSPPYFQKPVSCFSSFYIRASGITFMSVIYILEPTMYVVPTEITWKYDSNHTKYLNSSKIDFRVLRDFQKAIQALKSGLWYSGCIKTIRNVLLNPHAVFFQFAALSDR